jgi:hypothetical protein
MVTYRAFDEIIDFITSAPQPEQILAFRPSPSIQNRLEDLLEKKRETSLNEAEMHELDQFLLLEHLMRIAKAKARTRKRLAA